MKNKLFLMILNTIFLSLLAFNNDPALETKDIINEQESQITAENTQVSTL